MPSMKSDLAFGTANETKHHRILEGIFKKKLIHRGGFAGFDYDDGATFFVELKSRRIAHDKYPTAIIGANKVATAAANPARTYWFCYAYEDGMFGLQYNKELFDTFEKSDYSRGDREDYHNNAQECVFIPYNLLEKL
jgi:hypothetical protein